MGIGTSLGAFYRDEGHYAASKWDDRYDDNVIKPEQQETNKQLDAAEVSPSGPGIPIGYWPSEGGFDGWKSRNAPNDSGSDYDLKGAYSAGIEADSRGHMPDTFKLPNHITFSNESIYHGKDGNEGGQWAKTGIGMNGEGEGNWSFTPGKTNLANHSEQELKDYFAKYEPDSTLKLDTPPKGFFDRLSLINAARGMKNPSFDEDINMLKGFYETAKRGFTLPGEVKSGKVDPSSTEAIDRAADIAMMAVGGSAGTTSKGTLGSGVLKKDLSEVMAPHEVEEIMQKYKQVPFDHSKQYPLAEDFPKYKSYIDMYMDKHTNTVEDLLKKDNKLSFKEAFLQAAEETHTAFTAAAADIKAAFKAAAKEPDNLITAGKKDYTQPAYRGVKVHDNELSPVHSKAGERAMMYSSDSPLLADMYSSYLSSHPGVKVPPGTFSEGASVMPLYINTKNYHYYDAKGGGWEYNNGKAIGEAMDQGKHGVIVDNVWDEPNSTKALGSPKKIFITFPEGAHTVKSRFAKKFDEKSENMMHGIGVGGPAGYVAYQNLSDDLPDK